MEEAAAPPIAECGFRIGDLEEAPARLLIRIPKSAFHNRLVGVGFDFCCCGERVINGKLFHVDVEEFDL